MVPVQNIYTPVYSSFIQSSCYGLNCLLQSYCVKALVLHNVAIVEDEAFKEVIKEK